MVDVRGDDHAAAGNFVAHQLRREFLAARDIGHFLGDYALARIVHLREIAIAVLGPAFGQPRAARLGDRTASVTTLGVRTVCRRAVAGSHGAENLAGIGLTSDYTRP